MVDWLILLLAMFLWTLVLRWFPSIIMTAIEKKIDSKQSAKLASHTAELEASPDFSHEPVGGGWRAT